MKNIILILFVALLLSACNKDWLDIKPKGKVLLTKTKDFQLLLDNTTGAGGGLQESYSLIQYMSDDVRIPAQSINTIFDNVESFNKYYWKDNIYLSDKDDPDWKSLYHQIYVYNTCITQVFGKDISGSESDKKMICAQAKVNRAYNYFILVNEYAKQYNPNTAGLDKGVPLLIKPTLDKLLHRSTVEEIYKQILSDLNEALPDLPNLPEFTLRSSKASAYALLSRVYLFQANYPKSLENANKSLALQSFLYNYNDFDYSSSIYGKKPLIKFTLPFLNKEQILLRTSSNKGPILYISDDLKNLYNPKDDIRDSGMIASDANFGLTANKPLFIQNYLQRDLLYGISVPEVMLTKAECLARTGKKKDAIDVLNTLRRNRFKTGSHYELTIQGDVLRTVKDERRRELAFCGMRWFDVKRYNVFDKAGISIDHSLPNESHILNPGDKGWVLPIAKKIYSKES